MVSAATRFGISVLAAACVATAAHADDTPYAKYWRVMGTSGVPTTSTAALAQFNDTGSVSIRSSVSSGVVRLHYTVAAVDGVVWNGGTSYQNDLCLELVARAENSHARVRATLYSRQDPSIDPNAEPLGTADTDAVGYHWTGYGGFGNCNLHQPQSTAPLLSLDFGSQVYYVVAELIKTASTGNPGLMTVALVHEQP